ncbi:MAG: hypothetical protein B7Z75_05180 [Acidocella sp. 20-57-95]|nr:MAG: hypothetical protein B7Z75_05180 [Acidocella sp. 20-57-95]HQT64662.1 putative nucleotide-diphospho-sugar transferase [Acidocella sp.]
MSEKIKLHCMYTTNFEPMLIRFLSGLEDITDININNLSELQKQISGLGGGHNLWLFKINLLCDLADPSKNKTDIINLITDIDLAIYGPLKPTISEFLQTNDIVFQSEFNQGTEANIGVIAFRASEKVLYFWSIVKSIIESEKIWDQKAVNMVIARTSESEFSEIKTSLLPPKIWAFSQSRQLGFANCHNVILHHANCVENLLGKWLQLNEFSHIFRRDYSNQIYALQQVLRKYKEIEWTFGSLSLSEPYGTLKLSTNGELIGYSHENEVRLEATQSGLYFVNGSGDCTTYFSEFYYDPIRGKLLCVGRAMQEGIYHYLFSS